MVGETLEKRPAKRAAAAPQRAIAHWLLALCALIFAMVVLGGVTRLTQAGLSMVDWQPLMGILPPLDEAAWLALFHDYRQFPEYQKLTLGMTLAEFKRIFLFEYAHRLLGRGIGVAFVLPLLYFLVRGRVRGALAPKLAIMFVLGALQGLLGWYMVKSGLVDRPDVSPYRLTAHLGLAIVIYGYILWVAMGLLAPRQPRPAAGRVGRGYGVARVFAPVFAGLVFVTILSGGFVAGLDAGFAYNSFPLMEGRFVPLDVLRLEPAWRNAFENLPLVQLDHRLLAKLTLLAALGLWASSGAASARAALPVGARRALTALLAMALIQFGLGVATLLLVVPIPLAALHQAGALALFTLALWSCHELYRRPR